MHEARPIWKRQFKNQWKKNSLYSLKILHSLVDCWIQMHCGSFLIPGEYLCLFVLLCRSVCVFQQRDFLARSVSCSLAPPVSLVLSPFLLLASSLSQSLSLARACACVHVCSLSRSLPHTLALTCLLSHALSFSDPLPLLPTPSCACVFDCSLSGNLRKRPYWNWHLWLVPTPITTFTSNN